MRIDAVIFDFDGVIIDSEVTNFDAWTETFARYGAELTTGEYLESMGTRHVSTYELLSRKATLPVPDETTVRAVKRARHLELLAATNMLPGVAEWIAEARSRGLGIGLASSGDQSWLDEQLARVGLGESFDCVCCWDGEVPPKPAPDLYLRACGRLGAEPSTALAIEDSPNGLLSARRAGLRTLAVLHRLTLDVELVADIVIGSLQELSLARALARLESD